MPGGRNYDRRLIARPDPLARIRALFCGHPSVAILGPRSCGKTTLARIYELDDRLSVLPVRDFIGLPGRIATGC